MFDKGVIVFSGKDCTSCKTLKDKLKASNVSYIEYDVWENAEALRYLLSKGLRGIPHLFKDGVKVDVKDV